MEGHAEALLWGGAEAVVVSLGSSVREDSEDWQWWWWSDEELGKGMCCCVVW